MSLHPSLLLYLCYQQLPAQGLGVEEVPTYPDYDTSYLLFSYSCWTGEKNNKASQPKPDVCIRFSSCWCQLGVTVTVLRMGQNCYSVGIKKCVSMCTHPLKGYVIELGSQGTRENLSNKWTNNPKNEKLHTMWGHLVSALHPTLPTHMHTQHLSNPDTEALVYCRGTEDH